MTTKKEKLTRILLYTLFGLASFLFFLSLTFPFDFAEQQLLRILEAESGCTITINNSGYGFPAKVSYRGIDAKCPRQALGLGRTGEIALQLKSLEIALSPLPLLLKQKGEIDFKLVSKMGVIPGHLSISEMDEGLSFALSTKGTEITLAETGMSGLISLEGESKWLNQNLVRSRGKIAFTMTQARFTKIAGVTLPIGEVRFTKIAGRLFWKDGRIVIEQFTAQGDMANIKSESGTLLLRNPPKNSLMTLSLRAMPKGSLAEMATLFIKGYNAATPLKIRITGAIGAPKLSLNGKAIRLGF